MIENDVIGHPHGFITLPDPRLVPASETYWPRPDDGTKAGIGDVNSTEKGSGARYNAGKPDLSLIPLQFLAETMMRDAEANADAGSHKFVAAKAMYMLGTFQKTQEVRWLYEMFEMLGIDGWEECAHVFDYGKRVKYKAWNWAKGMPWSVPVACAARHLLAMWAGEHLDKESQHPHRGHVFCNGVMLIQFTSTYTEGNDLPPKGLL